MKFPKNLLEEDLLQTEWSNIEQMLKKTKKNWRNSDKVSKNIDQKSIKTQRTIRKEMFPLANIYTLNLYRKNQPIQDLNPISKSKLTNYRQLCMKK